MAQKKSEPVFDIILKGATAYIKSKAKMQQDRIKYQSALALKDIEQKQSFMTKIAEREYQTPYERMLMGQYRRQDVGAPAGDVFAPGPAQRRRVELGPKGPAVKTVGMKEAIYGNIMRIPEEQRTEKQRAFINRYLYGKAGGIDIEGEKEPTATERRIAGEIRALKKEEATLEDIQTHIRFQGYEPEDFAEELEGYATEEGFWPWSKERGVEQRGIVEPKLPSHIKRTSEAVKFLKRYYNMTDEQALDWLRKNR